MGKIILLPFSGNHVIRSDTMSKIIKSHFYIVKGTPKGDHFPTHGWLFHSYKELEDFALLVTDLIPEYDLEIIETYFNESEIMEKWEIK